jgi:hypothetical protein
MQQNKPKELLRLLKLRLLNRPIVLVTLLKKHLGFNGWFNFKN